MVPASKIKFEVDEHYENEKGVFRVISIHRNEMVIRWENGEEIRTDIELQRNIQARRQWEEMNRQAKKAKKSSAAGKQKGFIGFLPGDFKNTASGTNWRGRTQLGGEVVSLLPQGKFKFNSWAYAQKPELHWLDVKHRGRVGAESGARFFVRLTPLELIYGVYIRKSMGDESGAADWQGFTQWASQSENEQMLLTLADEQGLYIHDRHRPAAGILTSSGTGWRLESASKEKALGLAEFIDSQADHDMVLFEIAKKMDKVDAISRGKKIVEDIGKLFPLLVPLYAASASL